MKISVEVTNTSGDVTRTTKIEVEHSFMFLKPNIAMMIQAADIRTKSDFDRFLSKPECEFSEGVPAGEE